MTRVLGSRTCKEAIASLLLSVGGCAVVAELSRAESDDLVGVPSLIAVALVCMWMILFLVWLWRAAGILGGGKEEVLRRHSLSPQEAMHYRMFGGWICPACGRLNPTENTVCYVCSGAHWGSSPSNAPPSERTATFAPRSSADSGVSGRSVMEELARPRAWTYERFRRVLIASAVLDEDIPGAYTPDSVDLGKLARHAQDLTAKAAIDGNEWCRVFLVDVESRALLQGKTTKGNRRSVLPDWSGQPGREPMQRRSFCIHTHPMAMQTVAQGFSEGDYEGFLWDRQQRVIIMVSGDSTMMVLQTSATPRVSSPKGIDQTLDMIEREARRGAGTPGSADSVIDFNKEVCVQFGLCLYIGGEDGRMRRVRVV